MIPKAHIEYKIEFISNVTNEFKNFKIIVTRGKSFEELKNENMDKTVNHLYAFSNLDDVNSFYKVLCENIENSNTLSAKFRNEYLEEFYNMKNESVYNLYLLTW